MKSAAELPERFPYIHKTKIMDYCENNIQIVSTGFENLRLLEYTDLAHYAFSESEAFDVRSIENFSLAMHWKFHHQLTERYPELARTLYAHNIALQTLQSDIEFMEKKGQSPKVALERLIHGLTLGGVHITGLNDKDPAGKAAQDAYAAFFDYFDCLPQTLQKELKQLKGGVILPLTTSRNTLDAVFEWLNKGECAETAAAALHSIIEQNKNNPLLNISAYMSPEASAFLHKKYRNNSLSTAKDSHHNLILPSLWLQKAVSTVSPKTAEDLIILLLNFPPKFYDILFGNIKKDIPSNGVIPGSAADIYALAQAMQNGFFYSEQMAAITKAILIHFGLVAALYCAVSSNEPSILENLFQYFEKNALVKALNFHNKFGEKFILKAAAKSPKTFKVLLNFFPDVVSFVRTDIQPGMLHSGPPLMSLVAKNPESLRAVLECFSCAEEKLEFVRSNYSYGNTLLHFVAGNPESIKMILEIYPEYERIRALWVENELCADSLDYAKQTPESLTSIIALLHLQDKIRIVRVHRDIWGSLIDDESFRQKVFAGVPADDLFNMYCCAFSVLNSIGINETLVSKTIRYAYSFITNRFPKEEQLLKELSGVDNLANSREINKQIKKAFQRYLMLNQHNEPTLTQMKLLTKISDSTEPIDRANYADNFNRLKQKWDEEFQSQEQLDSNLALVNFNFEL